MADKEEKKKHRAVVEEVQEAPANVETPDVKEETPNPETESKKEEEQPEETKLVEHYHTADHMHAASTQTPPQPMKEEGMNIKFVIFLTAFIAIVFGGLAGGLIVYLTNTSQKQAEPSPSPLFASSEPVTSPTPATVDKTKFTINIQNGSGIAGQGAAVQKILTDAGFKVGTVGNAQTFDHKKTVIQAKDSVSQDFLSALSDTLSKTYSLDVTQKLATSSAADINVIVGSTKAGQ